MNSSAERVDASRNSRRPTWVNCIILFLIVLVCALFTASYVARETPGYYWDYVTYYDQLRTIKQEVGSGDWPGLLKTLINTRGSDYNLSPVVPLLPIFLVVSLSRISYILSLVIFYLIPAAIVLVLIIKECWKPAGRGISFFLALGFVLLYPMFWAPTLRGYTDVAALIPMGLAGLILFRTRWILLASVRQALLFGVFLYATFLLRRHYAYTIVAMVAIGILFAGWHVVFTPGRRRAFVKALARNYIFAGFAILIPAVIIQGPLIKRILTTSYESVYAAYQKGFLEKLWGIYAQNGPLWIFLVGCGCLYTIYSRNEKLLYCLGVGVLGYALFQSTQAPYIHHTVPFYFWLAPLTAWPLSLINAQRTAFRRIGLGALLLGILSMVSLPSLAWNDIKRFPLLAWSKPLQASESYPPFKLKSYPVLMELVNELESENYAHKKVLVLASSFEFNPSILRSLSPDLASRILDAGDVDLRDGFSIEKAIEADYIIATVEPSLHLPWKHQQVIVIPSRELFEPTNPFGKHFSMNLQKPFVLADGNTAYIFKRTSDLSPEAISWLTSRFRERYASWQRNGGIIGPPQR
ncbi:hypothetical protein [Cyanobium sp. ULC084]